MPPTATSSRPFELGTIGWTVADLEDPQIEAQWFDGRYEIVEGVLTKMSPGYFVGGRALKRLERMTEDSLKQQGVLCDFASEVDLVIDDQRIARPDSMLLTVADQKKQNSAALATGRVDPDQARILIPPTLIIESVSPGHEQHDRKTKRNWYAEFGVPNYWILDYFGRSLECLVLAEGSYRLDVAGREIDVVRPSAFQPLSIPLAALWQMKGEGSAG
ncbi:MAG TPA: Uma2 family endonuclease [Tepidisphaeraceae bacterium]|jgi:Uma2 family endonuclease